MMDPSNNNENILPNSITDEGAYVLSGLLHDLALACDEKYYAQIRRHISHTMAVHSEMPEHEAERDDATRIALKSKANNSIF